MESKRTPFIFPSRIEISYLLVGEFLVFWYAWLLDDAYVYFRYVDNLVMYGRGLVWNAGEFVEGFSSPAWTLLLIPLRALHLNYWHIILGLGAISFAAFWYIACIISRRLTAPENRHKLQVNFPLAFLSLSYGPVAHFTSGTETPLVLLMAAAYAGAFTRPRSRIFQIFVGLSPLVRPELLVSFVIYIAYTYFREKIVSWRAIVTFIASSGGYLLFRIWYYAELLPNTFYLKDGFYPLQGLAFLLDTALAYNLIPLAIGAILILKLLHTRMGIASMAWERSGMVLCALPIIFYTIKVGGSASHFRYLAFPVALISLSVGGGGESAAYYFTKSPRVLLKISGLVLALLFLLSYPRQLVYHPLLRNYLGFDISRFVEVTEPSFHRLQSERFFNGRTRITPRLGFGASYLSWDAAMQRYLQEKESTVIYERGWCLLGYLHPSTPVIQIFGLTDPFLSRLEVEAVRPGHKPELIPAASDIASIRAEYGFRRGAIPAALRDGHTSAPWVSDNLQSVYIIENKAYNNHNLLENLRLSFNLVSSLSPGQHDRTSP